MSQRPGMRFGTCEILDPARRKVEGALVQGRALPIEGGPVRRGRTHRTP